MEQLEQLLAQAQAWVASLGPQDHLMILAAGLGLIIFAVAALLVQRLIQSSRDVDHAAQSPRSTRRREDAFVRRLEQISQAKT